MAEFLLKYYCNLKELVLLSTFKLSLQKLPWELKWCTKNLRKSLEGLLRSCLCVDDTMVFNITELQSTRLLFVFFRFTWSNGLNDSSCFQLTTVCGVDLLDPVVWAFAITDGSMKKSKSGSNARTAIFSSKQILHWDISSISPNPISPWKVICYFFVNQIAVVHSNDNIIYFTFWIYLIAMVDNNWTVTGVLEKRLLPMPFMLSLCGSLNHVKNQFRLGCGFTVGVWLKKN